MNIGGRTYFRNIVIYLSVLNDGVYAGSEVFLFGIGGHVCHVHIFCSEPFCTLVRGSGSSCWERSFPAVGTAKNVFMNHYYR